MSLDIEARSHILASSLARIAMLSFEQLPQRLEDACRFDGLGQVGVVADL